MRKLMALAIVFLTAVPSSFALFGLGDISYDGSLEVSGNAANNEVDFGNDPDSTTSATDGTGTANDHRGRTATRVRLGMTAQVTEGVNGRIEAIRTGRQYGTGATTIAGEEGMWAFHNAYVELEDLWGFKARLGRQYVGNPGDLVWNISPTDDDNLTANSIDGLLLQCRRYDFLHTDIFTGKATEDDTLTGAVSDTDQNDGAAAGDVNLSAIDFVLPTIVPGGKINVGYLLGDDDNSQLSTDDNSLRIARVGINGGVKENWLTYRAEYLQNMGQFNGAGKLAGAGPAREDLDYEGSAIDLGVGLNLPETSIGTFGLWLNWLAASGDDDTSDSSDDSFHDFSPLGINTSDRLLGEIFGKSNVLGRGTPLGQGLNSADASGGAFNAGTQGQGLEVINVGAQFKPTFLTRTMLRLDYYMFSRAEDSVTTAPNTTAQVGDDLGSEIDLTVGYDHSSSVNVELGYAMLMPDDGLTGIAAPGAPSFQDDNITKFFARAKIKWGGEAK
jgi:hypothetical protein